MKKILYTLVAISLILVIIKCEKSSDNPADNITLSMTIPGGCNGETFALNKDAMEEEDTVTFTTINDTLDIFVGVNYICCAPFETGASISNDSINIIITDICDVPYMECYCRCMCYYTWDFLFTNFAEKEYYIKIILNDPREEDPIVLAEGMLDLS